MIRTDLATRQNDLTVLYFTVLLSAKGRRKGTIANAADRFVAIELQTVTLSAD